MCRFLAQVSGCLWRRDLGAHPYGGRVSVRKGRGPGRGRPGGHSCCFSRIPGAADPTVTSGAPVSSYQSAMPRCSLSRLGVRARTGSQTGADGSRSGHGAAGCAPLSSSQLSPCCGSQRAGGETGRSKPRGLTLMTSSTPRYLPGALLPDAVPPGVRAYEFRGDTLSPYGGIWLCEGPLSPSAFTRDF